MDDGLLPATPVVTFDDVAAGTASSVLPRLSPQAARRTIAAPAAKAMCLLISTLPLDLLERCSRQSVAQEFDGFERLTDCNAASKTEASWGRFDYRVLTDLRVERDRQGATSKSHASFLKESVSGFMAACVTRGFSSAQRLAGRGRVLRLLRLRLRLRRSLTRNACGGLRHGRRHFCRGGRTVFATTHQPDGARQQDDEG